MRTVLLERSKAASFGAALSLAALLALFASGCTTFQEKPSVYVPEPALDLNSPPIESLMVRIIGEQPAEETLPFDPNNDPWILMPLCFYSSKNVNPMVKRDFMQNDVEEAFRRLFAKDLRASGLCGEVFICEGGRGGGANRVSDAYRLDITLKHAVWHRSLTAYGLSYPGTLLWVLGAPVSYGYVALELEVALYPPGSKGKLLAVKTFKREEDCVEWIYEQIGYQPAKSETILTEMFPGLASDVRLFIKEAVAKKKGK
jgi:hypothetical protein